MLKKLFKKIYGTKDDSAQNSKVVANQEVETKEEEIVIENSEEVEIETTEETVVEEQQEEVVVEETTEEAVVEEQQEEVVVEETTEEAVAEEQQTYENNFLVNQSTDVDNTEEVATEETVVEEQQEEVVVEETTEEMLVEEQQEEMLVEEQQEEVVAEETTEEVVVEETTEEAVAEEQQEEVVAEETVVEEQQEEVVAEETTEEMLVEEQQEEMLVEEQQEEMLVEETEQHKFKNNQALFLDHNDMLDDEKEVSGYTARANHLRVINEYNNEIDRNDYVQAYFRLVSVFKIFYKYRDVATVNEELLLNVKMQVELFKAIEDKTNYEFYRESDGWLYKDNKWSPKSIACFKNYIILHEKNNMIEEAIAMCDLAIDLGYENSDGTKMGIRGRKAKLEKLLANK